MAVGAGVIAFSAGSGPHTVLDLQPFRDVRSVALRMPSGRELTATLINLNPTIGAWYVLKLPPGNGGAERAYHLENPRPGVRSLRFDARYTAGIVILEGSTRHECDLFTGTPSPLERAAASGAVYHPLCDGRIYLRNHAAGRHTRLESAADLVRERVWAGESLLGLGHRMMGDRNLETGTVGSAGRKERPLQTGPMAALLDPGASQHTIASDNLGINLAGGEKALAPGRWYAVSGLAGVFVSILQPGMVAAGIRQGGEKSVSALDAVESTALCYLVAFDLDQFAVGYAGGTEHPSVGWSAHMSASMRDDTLPGPDGIGTIAPLVPTGLVNPDEAPLTVATFTGGFKRDHGAFLYGELATRNRGTHYGFIENGVVLSTLQPALATLLVTADGRVEMKTWDDSDNARLRLIRHARQNGVPIVESDRNARTTVPGRLVNQWGAGNWSGSQAMKLRTIRAAAALQSTDREQYLVYAVFSAATPSAMARVFQAYQCRYAMLLDMNALEHTYMALLKRDGTALRVEYLLKGMSVVDKTSGGSVVPRFVAAPDNRDFFYVMRRARAGPP